MSDQSYQNPLCWSIGTEPRREIDAALFRDEYDFDPYGDRAELEAEETSRYRELDEFDARFQDAERNR